MSLFFVRHQHTPEACPAKDPEMGNMLLAHLSQLNANKYGLVLQGDAVLDGQHTLVMIVDSPNRENIDNFMQPFKQAGSVEIIPASSCETVVQRSGC
jgi:hypothetical protein